MKKTIKLLSLILTLLLVLCGCGNNADTQADSENTTQDSNTATDTDFLNSDDMFTENDYEVGYDIEASTAITLNGSSAACDADSVEISGTTVTIKDEGIYIISGTLNDGMIIVDAEETDKPRIILNGANITSGACAPLYILNADKVFVTLAQGSENTLSNGGSFTSIDDNNIDGTVFSKQDLTFNGSGSLTVSSPAGHGIVCKDDLVFTSGAYTVNSASHGLDANDSVRIANADITIDAGKDGIHTENNDDTTKGFFYAASGSLNIEAEGDGISSALYSQIADGSFSITAGGGSENASLKSSENYGGFMGGGFGGPGGNMGGRGNKGMQITPTAYETDPQDDSDESTSMKGIKSSGKILISNGTFKINSADDGIHSDTSLAINGGSFEIASGDDGIHAEESLTVSGGEINITESYEGLEALDISVSGGNVKLIASDDGFNAAGGTDASGFGGRDNGNFGGGPGGMGGMSSSSNGTIVISGGEIRINASGDGIDANGSVEITGGYTAVTGPTQGDTATLDYDTTAVISGGTFIGTGASGMAQTFSSSENQGIVAVSVGNQSAGTEFTITDSNGNTIISHSPELDYAVAIVSTPDIQKGETYTVSVGGSSGEFEAS